MKMKKMYKSLLSMLLALTMLFSSQAFSESVYAAYKVSNNVKHH